MHHFWHFWNSEFCITVQAETRTAAFWRSGFPSELKGVSSGDRSWFRLLRWGGSPVRQQTSIWTSRYFGPVILLCVPGEPCKAKGTLIRNSGLLSLCLWEMEKSLWRREEPLPWRAQAAARRCSSPAYRSVPGQSPGGWGCCACPMLQ